MKIRPFFPVLLAFAALAPVARAQEGPLKINSPVPFRSIARLHRLSAKGKNFGARLAYPTFRAPTRLARFVNAQVGHDQRAAYTAWLKTARSELAGGFTPPVPLEWHSVPSLTYFSPSRLISLRFDSYQYMGGIHGMSIMDARNFALVAGKPKQLSLGDLFVPGSDYRKRVETQLFAKLKKNQAATWVQDGSVKTLTTNQFNNFSIARDGITWLFNEYEMGPYANGPIEAKLAFSELGPHFKHSLLKGR